MVEESIYLNHVGLLCAAGNDVASLKAGLQSSHDFLTQTSDFGTRSLPLGLCKQALPEIPLAHPQWQSRNNQLALAVYKQIESEVQQALVQYGKDRVGVIIGTSTAGIGSSESAFKVKAETGVMPETYHYSIQEMGATARFIAEISGVAGPVYGVSTACSSGAKAIISARRLIQAGVCDVVIAGGVDTLCDLTVQGFSALEAVSDTQCNPFSANRKGINIGEAGALFVISKQPIGVALQGVGESSDAHHISAPEPSGRGAKQSMLMALGDANLKPGAVDYINLHGTATQLNDQMEARAVHEVFGEHVLCSSTKPFTGHTLGAAGALEAAIAWTVLTDQERFIPPQRWDREYDTSLPKINLVNSAQADTKVHTVLSNSFAFGGNNVSLIIGRI